MDIFLENGFAIDKMDEYWFKFKVLQTKGLIEPTFGVLLKAIFFYFIGMYGYGFFTLLQIQKVILYQLSDA